MIKITSAVACHLLYLQVIYILAASVFDFYSKWSWSPIIITTKTHIFLWNLFSLADSVILCQVKSLELWWRLNICLKILNNKQSKKASTNPTQRKYFSFLRGCVFFHAGGSLFGICTPFLHSCVSSSVCIGNLNVTSLSDIYASSRKHTSSVGFLSSEEVYKNNPFFDKQLTMAKISKEGIRYWSGFCMVDSIRVKYAWPVWLILFYPLLLG